jgi:hypothetical protein
MRKYRVSRSLYANPKQLTPIYKSSQRVIGKIPHYQAPTDTSLPDLNSSVRIEILPRKPSPRNDLIGMSYPDTSGKSLGTLSFRTETPQATIKSSKDYLRSSPETLQTAAHELTHLVDVRDKQIPATPKPSQTQTRHSASDEKKAYAYDSLIAAKDYYSQIGITPTVSQFREKALYFATLGNPSSKDLTHDLSRDAYTQFFP